MLEEIWESLEERSDMANQLIDSWKGDAEKHKRLLRHSALPAASQELQIKQVRPHLLYMYSHECQNVHLLLLGPSHLV